MKVSLITIGDEVLIGQIVNSNATWISDAVTTLGATVVEHVTVGDSAPELIAAIDRCKEYSEVLLLTGGLGPTHDDITKTVLAQYFNDVIVESAEWVAHLEEWMSKRGRALTDRNRGQALVPSSAVLLANPIGTAPGLLFDREDLMVVAMPGVPNEMKYIMEHGVLPVLTQRINAQHNPITQYSTLLTTGIAESNLADLIGNPEEFLGTSTLAFLPNYHGVRLRIGVSGASPHDRERERMRVASIIRQRAGAFIYGHDKQTLAEVVGKHLVDRRETLSVAESCTGGMVGAVITDVPGCSAWFAGGVISYSNEVKMRELGVGEWELQTHGAVSEIVAKQMADGVRQKLGTSYGIGITGTAGPDGGTYEKPVGTVWIALSAHDATEAVLHQFGSDRKINRERSVGAALGMLWKRVR